jgi:type VI secretion system protein ImpE
MNAKELLQAGRLDESLATLQDEVRKSAADPKLRVFLFQELCVLGNWERALTQLDVLGGFGSEEQLMSKIFRPVVQCEMLRKEIFTGKRTPVIFGEPAEWMSWLVQANDLVAQEKLVPARELRDRAFEAAPVTSGKLNGNPFEWIADADPRLGPMLEVVMEGQYYWVPFCRIQRLFIEPPTDLRDLVWAPAQFVWANGGEASGHIPTRYAGTESHPDNQLRLARKTEWLDRGEGYSLGLGHRILATDAEELPLLECRTLEMNAAA